jgi:hypothetical protein
MAGLTGRRAAAGRTSSATVNQRQNEIEGENKDCEPLQTCTPEIMMISDKLLETVEL